MFSDQSCRVCLVCFSWIQMPKASACCCRVSCRNAHAFGKVSATSRSPSAPWPLCRDAKVNLNVCYASASAAIADATVECSSLARAISGLECSACKCATNPKSAFSRDMLHTLFTLAVQCGLRKSLANYWLYNMGTCFSGWRTNTIAPTQPANELPSRFSCSAGRHATRSVHNPRGRTSRTNLIQWRLGGQQTPALRCGQARKRVRQSS